MFKGFFNRMYNGNPNRPDMTPEDMPKNRFELFFTTLGLRFGDLVKLNLLYFVFTLPLILWTVYNFMVVNAGVSDLLKQWNIDAGMSMTADQLGQLTQAALGYLWFYLVGLLVLLPLAGPPTAGFTYILRNYARDEHSWLWADFKEQMKKNWKQSALAMFFMALILLLTFYTLQFYGPVIARMPWAGFMETLFIVFVCLAMLSFMYAFPMLVTYEMKMRHVVRNSLMLALGRLPMTIIFGILTLLPLVLGLVLLFLIGSNLILIILGLYFLLIGFSLPAFIVNSYTNATFDKLMKTEEPIHHPEDDMGEGKP